MLANRYCQILAIASAAVGCQDAGVLLDPAPDDSPAPGRPAEEVPGINAIESRLASLNWVTGYPGSEADYITWYTFDPAALTVTMEARPVGGDGEIRWTDESSWTVGSEAMVAFDWSEYRPWDDSVATFSRAWTFVPVEGALRSRMYPEGWFLNTLEAPAEGPVWSGLAVRAVNSARTRYVGSFSQTSIYPNDVYDEDARRLELEFDGPLVEGQDCTASLTLSVSVRAGGARRDRVDQAGTEAFLWGCTVTGGAQDGLLTVDFDRAWGEGLWDREIPGALADEMYDAFNTPLFFDPQDTSILGFASAVPYSNPPLLVGTGTQPPIR